MYRLLRACNESSLSWKFFFVFAGDRRRWWYLVLESIASRQKDRKGRDRLAGFELCILLHCLHPLAGWGMFIGEIWDARWRIRFCLDLTWYERSCIIVKCYANILELSTRLSKPLIGSCMDVKKDIWLRRSFRRQWWIGIESHWVVKVCRFWGYMKSLSNILSKHFQTARGSELQRKQAMVFEHSGLVFLTTSFTSLLHG